MELKLLRVEVLAFEDKFDAAETLLDEIQNINVANEEIYIQRANIRSKQDKHQEAVNLLLEALDITDRSFDIHSLLGMEYLLWTIMSKQSSVLCDVWRLTIETIHPFTM